MSKLSGRLVMVVEDAFYLAMDIQSELEESGAEVAGPFSTCEAAMEGLDERRPDFAILDVKLKDGDTFSLARALRSLSIGFLFFTGYDQSAIPDEFADVARVEKPADVRQLVREIELRIADA